MNQAVLGADTMAEGAEKRRSPRYLIDMSIRVGVRCTGGLKPVFGRGHDLNDYGMAVFVPVELGIGEYVELDVTLPYSTQPLKLRAVVRNRRSFTYGVEFTNLTPAQQAAIERACRSLSLVQ